MIGMLHDLLGLFFPRLCLACGVSLFRHEEFICGRCWLGLPITHFHKERDNPVAKVFWGRVWLENAASCYFYTKGNRVQKLIHQLKYKGEEDLGFYLGENYGIQLRKDGFLADCDALVPVPLHPKKFRKRGYNQAEAIAKGLASGLQKEVWTDVVVRNHFTETQTRKSRYNRWQNVENIFGLRNELKIRGKHIVLVDDVITTGSTLEACLQTLKTVEGIKLSVLSLAYSYK